MNRPQRIGDVLSELLAKRGLGRIAADEALHDAWRASVGEWSEQTTPGPLRRGVLEIRVTSSALVQELTFRKPELLDELARRLPDERIVDLRFRVGPVE